MLSNILADITLLLRKKTALNESDLAELLILLGNYRAGMWIYPGVLKRKLNISINQAYAILDTMQKGEFLESYYELYCSHCQKSNGTVYRTFNEIPQTFTCEICNCELPAVENTVIIYKVIKG